MAHYDFRCDECKELISYIGSIADGPPSIACPKCKKLMYQDFSPPEVLFKGGGWPGKDIKMSQDSIQAREQTEKMLHEHDVAQKEADEVLSVRRKGRKAYNEFATKFPERIQRYNENMKKGVKGR